MGNLQYELQKLSVTRYFDEDVENRWMRVLPFIERINDDVRIEKKRKRSKKAIRAKDESESDDASAMEVSGGGDGGGNNISLRMWDHFVTTYARGQHCEYMVRGNLFNVYHSMQTMLVGLQKRRMDPFRRRYRGFDTFVYRGVTTSVGQLTFFRWCLLYDVIDYVVKHQASIRANVKAVTAANHKERPEEEDDKVDAEGEKKKNNATTAATYPFVDKMRQTAEHIVGDKRGHTELNTELNAELNAELNTELNAVLDDDVPKMRFYDEEIDRRYAQITLEQRRQVRPPERKRLCTRTAKLQAHVVSDNTPLVTAD